MTYIAAIITMQHWHKLSVRWFVSQVLLVNQHNSLIYICTCIFFQWVIFPPLIASMHIECRLWILKIHHVWQHVGSKVYPLDASLDPTVLAFPPLWASQNARHPNTYVLPACNRRKGSESCIPPPSLSIVTSCTLCLSWLSRCVY